MHENRNQRRRMRQGFNGGFTEHDGLNLAKNRGEGNTQRDQQNRRGPRIFMHRGGNNQKLAGKHAERRHTQNCQRAQNQAPAYGRADLHQATNMLHLLRTGFLHRMSHCKENRRFSQRMHGHVQHRSKGRNRPAHAERKSNQPHMLDG